MIIKISYSIVDITDPLNNTVIFSNQLTAIRRLEQGTSLLVKVVNVLPIQPAVSTTILKRSGQYNENSVVHYNSHP